MKLISVHAERFRVRLRILLYRQSPASTVTQPPKASCTLIAPAALQRSRLFTVDLLSTPQMTMERRLPFPDVYLEEWISQAQDQSELGKCGMYTRPQSTKVLIETIWTTSAGQSEHLP